MRPKKAIRISAIVLVATGIAFYVTLAILSMLGMRDVVDDNVKLLIGFWVGSALTVIILNAVMEDEDDREMD